MKTKKELSALKEEAAALNRKHAELTEDEMMPVTGVVKKDGPGLSDDDLDNAG